MSHDQSFEEAPEPLDELDRSSRDFVDGGEVIHWTRKRSSPHRPSVAVSNVKGNAAKSPTRPTPESLAKRVGPLEMDRLGRPPVSLILPRRPLPDEEM